MTTADLHFPDHHGDVSEEDEEGEPLTWGLDNVELLTVGVDIGSSTSHLLFSRLRLSRLAQSLSSRFVVVSREVLHRSPILLTPFTPDGLLQITKLQQFVDAAYQQAGITAEDVDSGAVILTGQALEKRNSRAVAQLFEGYCGRFVCATAGHNLEAILAAHGSGAVARSRADREQALHINIGGGTSKLAIVQNGAVLATAALGVGARVEHPDGPAGMAAALQDAATGAAHQLLLTPPLPPADARRVSFSGGVAEYLYGRERRAFGDRGPEVVDARHGSIQGSLDRLDLEDGGGPVALALAWSGEPRYAVVRELAARIAQALPRTLSGGVPLVLAIDADVGRSLGQVLVEDFAPSARVAALDGLDLRELDYLDVGEMLRPAGVVPVVIKSLAFPA